MENRREPLRLEPRGREDINILKEVKGGEESKGKIVVVWTREKRVL